MRKAILGLLLACILAVPTPALAEETSTTVLVYMAGSDLESETGSGSADLREMVKAGIPASGSLRVLVQTGGAKKWANDEIPSNALGRFQVDETGLTLLETQKDASMGKAGTLADFIAFGLKEAPADRYILVLWGHGSGATGGVCLDSRHWEDTLMPKELGRALREGLGGAHLDAVMFDACTMSCVEIAETLAPYADYMVASQALTSGWGLEYDRWLGELVQNPEISSRDLCVQTAQTYLSAHSFGVFSGFYAMSVLDLSKAEELTRSVGALYLALGRRLGAQADDVIGRRATLRSFGEFEGSDPSDFVDALRLADVFSDLEPRACAALRRAVSRMVVYNGNTNPSKGQAYGISMTMPYATAPWMYLIYDYYDPLYSSSDYARLIVDMAEEVERRNIAVQSGGDGQMLPKEEMWTGLTDEAA